MASIAAGNAGVPVRVGDEPMGRYGGMAPQARIAVYKACWGAPDPADDGCATADLVTAIDRASARRGRRDQPRRAAGRQRSTRWSAPCWARPRPTSSSPRRPATPAPASTPPTPARGSPPSAAPPAGPGWAGSSPPAARGSRGRWSRPGRCVPRAWWWASECAREARAVTTHGCARPAASMPAGSPGRSCCAGAAASAGWTSRGPCGCADGAGMVLVNVSPGGVAADFHSVPTVHLADDQGRVLRRWAARHPACASRAATGRRGPRAPARSRAGRAPAAPSSACSSPTWWLPASGVLGAVPRPGGLGLRHRDLGRGGVHRGRGGHAARRARAGRPPRCGRR